MSTQSSPSSFLHFLLPHHHHLLADFGHYVPTPLHQAHPLQDHCCLRCHLLCHRCQRRLYHSFLGFGFLTCQPRPVGGILQCQSLLNPLWASFSKEACVILVPGMTSTTIGVGRRGESGDVCRSWIVGACMSRRLTTSPQLQLWRGEMVGVLSSCGAFFLFQNIRDGFSSFNPSGTMMR